MYACIVWRLREGLYAMAAKIMFANLIRDDNSWMKFALGAPHILCVLWGNNSSGTIATRETAATPKKKHNNYNDEKNEYIEMQEHTRTKRTARKVLIFVSLTHGVDDFKMLFFFFRSLQFEIYFLLNLTTHAIECAYALSNLDCFCSSLFYFLSFSFFFSRLHACIIFPF